MTFVPHLCLPAAASHTAGDKTHKKIRRSFHPAGENLFRNFPNDNTLKLIKKASGKKNPKGLYPSIFTVNKDTFKTNAPGRGFDLNFFYFIILNPKLLKSLRVPTPNLTHCIKLCFIFNWAQVSARIMRS